jgi:hypothetical protein
VNLGLGNLNELKRHLLSESMRAQTTYDAAITTIGRGVAAQFDKYCNRTFERAVDATAEFSAERDHYYLPRYPIEAVGLVEQRNTLTEGWVPLPANALIFNRDDAIGLIHFYGSVGNWAVRLRVTYTGGYWFETLEPAEEDYPSAQPEGATGLPADVKLAWLLQAGRIWELIDKLGTNISPDKTVQFVSQTLSNLSLITEVKEVLDAHKRFMLT